MSKLQQLEQIRQWRLPTPPFLAVRYEDFQRGAFDVGKLRFPVAVRSSYALEDGDEHSHAGQFATVLSVEEGQLEEALEEVFNSYPEPEGGEAIVQEMIDPEYSGVLFAFREGVWKLELIEGQGEGLVSGHARPETILLPRFNRADAWASAFYSFWEGFPGKGKSLNRALVWLSYYAQALLRRMEAEYGLDIEFCISNGRLLLLQARPITTPEEAEEVLTSANHKEILPPRPSPLMTAIISKAGYRLFDYYRGLDPTLPRRAFIREAAAMPWINLSALLDVMVHWGLPTQLVCRSVGADDVYQVGLRPYRMLAKLPVFLKVLYQQMNAKKRVETWLDNTRGRFAWRRQHRQLLWENRKSTAFKEWLADFESLYVELVSNMQVLTGAMSGPLALLDRLGLLSRLSAALEEKSASTDYLRAFSDLQYSKIDRAAFLERFGHRGFYESDIGQKRFFEYSEADWKQLLGSQSIAEPIPPKGRTGGALWARLLAPAVRLMHTREWLRDETMKLFWDFRKELLEQTDFPFWEYRPENLKAYFAGKESRNALPEPQRTSASGWDMDTFLCNGNGRRLPLRLLANVTGRQNGQAAGIGIYPGKVEGYVWRVRSAGLDNLQPPAAEPVILVADALDPGWAPYFSRVKGVISYVGGLLSHASIILRESRIPAITQLPAHIELQNGDWIEMDGQTGEVRVLSERESEGVREGMKE
ncbi:MAG: hypothetical protein J5I94_12785 [Phaeodactylibacter sp.]|nr:hypothetical protein [Phaeodactylibacter sp.]